MPQTIGSSTISSLTATESIRFLGYESITRGNEPGEETTGIIARKPEGPSPKHNSTAQNLHFDHE